MATKKVDKKKIDPLEGDPVTFWNFKDAPDAYQELATKTGTWVKGGPDDWVVL